MVTAAAPDKTNPAFVVRNVARLVVSSNLERGLWILSQLHTVIIGPTWRRKKNEKKRKRNG